MTSDVEIELLACARGKHSVTILADPRSQLQNCIGKIAPEHNWLNLYNPMTIDKI